MLIPTPSLLSLGGGIFFLAATGKARALMQIIQLKARYGKNFCTS